LEPSPMRLEEFNRLSKENARAELFKCCGCTTWANKLIDFFPFSTVDALKEKSDLIWNSCNEADWKEAFSHHPKIGEKKIDPVLFDSTKSWAEDEQSGVKMAEENILVKLANANMRYENRFGFIFIVCATGKTADEMLEIITERLMNDPKKEIQIAAEEQNKITHLRIDKLVS
jgi:2-oxo-4-hydroxy-4-carboxy-5-ureidoimidazoline decarboxylase